MIGEVSASAILVLALAGCLAFIALSIYLLDRLLASIGRSVLADQRASKRAEALLQSILTAEEYGRYRSLGYLEVVSRCHPGRVYRISQDGKSLTSHENGRFSASYCIGPVERVPSADAVAVHKLMLEGAERDYLTLANARVMYQDRS